MLRQTNNDSNSDDVIDHAKKKPEEIGHRDTYAFTSITLASRQPSIYLLQRTACLEEIFTSGPPAPRQL